jgi:hypothetical protein
VHGDSGARGHRGIAGYKRFDSVDAAMPLFQLEDEYCWLESRDFALRNGDGTALGTTERSTDASGSTGIMTQCTSANAAMTRMDRGEG